MEQKCNLIEGRGGFGICYLREYIYVTGGTSQYGELQTCERYNIIEDYWSSIPDIP